MNITREQLAAAVRALGLDPDLTAEIHMTPDRVVARVAFTGEDGRILMTDVGTVTQNLTLDVVP